MNDWQDSYLNPSVRENNERDCEWRNIIADL